MDQKKRFYQCRHPFSYLDIPSDLSGLFTFILSFTGLRQLAGRRLSDSLNTHSLDIQPSRSVREAKDRNGMEDSGVYRISHDCPGPHPGSLPNCSLPVQYDRTARETIGWDTLGKAVHEVVQTMPDKEDIFIFGIRYQLASELAFYIPGQPRTVSINRWTRPNVYDYWFDDSMLIGRNGVGVTEHKIYIQLLELIFDDVVIDREVPIYRYSPLLGRELVTTFYIFKSFGFKGGQRWQPINFNDIRATDKQT